VKFYFDEIFPKAAAGLLESLGHEWVDPRGTELEGSQDSVLGHEAIKANAVLLTTDRDFFHTLHNQFPDHPGIVVIALKQPNRAAILTRLKWLLEAIEETEFRGRAFQLRDETWIARPPLKNGA
jgi:predicted nuclease of predicted toxin-antitoxin system